MASKMQKGMKIQQEEKADYTHFQQESPKVEQKMKRLREMTQEMGSEDPIPPKPSKKKGEY